MMGLLIEHPGAHTSVQDLGRVGQRSCGVSMGGAVDPLAARVANWLVGNDAGAALLECALVGPTIRFLQRAVVAITGATFAHLPHAQPFEVHRGQSISLKPLADRAYAYLAISGGIDVPRVLGSRSTELRSGWGGIEGRLLRTDDRLRVGPGKIPSCTRDWRVHLEAFYRQDQPLRILAGQHAGDFRKDWMRPAYTVSASSNRMGIRLKGPPLKRKPARELQSMPIAPGAIQIPPDGQPIILLADAQTMGGYPVIGHVITADLPTAAQLRPGSVVRFESLSLPAAHRALGQQEKMLAMLKVAIGAKWAR